MSHTKDRLQLCESLKTDQLCSSYCELRYRQTNHATYAVSHAKQTIASSESHITDRPTMQLMLRVMLNRPLHLTESHITDRPTMQLML